MPLYKEDNMNFDEIMEYNKPYNKRNFDSLLQNIVDNKIVPYIGAGMSMLFKEIYPSWSGFLYKTFDEFCSEYSKDEFNDLEYEDKADFLYNEIGDVTFSEYLKETFAIGHLNKDENEFIDKAIYYLPIIFDKGLILTTNYDWVIEKMFLIHKKSLHVAHPGHFEALNGALRADELLLFKIHGDIKEPINTVILTKEQYNKAYNNDELIESLTQVYISKSILFLGCSLEKDRPLQLLCEKMQPGMINYAIVECNEDEKKTRRLNLERELNTQSILYPYGEHECVKVIFEEIIRRISSRKSVQDIYSKTIELTEEWFIKQNTTQIKNLGNRYLPELNIDVAEKEIFNAINRNKEFYAKFHYKTDNLIVNIRRIRMVELEGCIKELTNIINSIDTSSNYEINIDTIMESLDEVKEFLDKTISKNKNKIVEIEDNIRGKNRELEEKEKLQSEKREINEHNFKIRDIIEKINNYVYYLNSSEMKVANNPFLLLSGEGGIGKSHLLADTVNRRIKEGKKSLFFLGQHFKEIEDPISTIVKMLELDWTTDTFLKELNEIGKRDKSRILIFIDALNEGKGKEIWSNFLGGVVDRIKSYSWLGIVLSIRTEYVEHLLHDNDILRETLINVKHRGFLTVEYNAIKKYFNFYNIKFSDIPFASQEFRNPLFLRLLCEGFKDKDVDLNRITFSEVYKNYLKEINVRIANKCQYSKRINMVEKIINDIVLFKYSKGKGSNFISVDDFTDIVIELEKKNNITSSIIDELFSEGIITQNISYDNIEYVYVTYEKLEDYLYAKLLVQELDEIGIEEFYRKYSSLKYREDILEVLAIVLSESNKYEIFEIFEENKNKRLIINAFCSALKWRSSDSIEEKTIKYINEFVIKSNWGFNSFFNSVILLSTKIGHVFNAKKTVDYILSFEMADRDSIFIPMYNNLYSEEGSPLNRVLDWCINKKVYNNVLDETIYLAAIMVSTFLISSNNELRDRATKALVNLLKGKIDILMEVMNKFEEADDPYIIERVYAVAFGCVVFEENVDNIDRLAKFVYDKVFSKEYVYPNILMRDYAMNIVEYAKHVVPSNQLKELDVQPPYKSNMPLVPSDEEIEKYEYDYKANGFKDYYWSQNTILSSMKVEYDREGSPGGYGDFGRYVFQRYFSEWKGLDYNDLKNIAIKKIFDMGYNVEKHGEFDRDLSRYYKENNACERIGKKYQWIALYELAAQVADNYKMEINADCCGDKVQDYCKGSFIPYIRNIDPTAIALEIKDDTEKKLHLDLYNIPKLSNVEWLSTFNDIPDINKLVNIKYKGEEFALLNGWYTWTEQNEIGRKKYEIPQKDMWIQINSYIVKSNEIKSIIEVLKDRDFMGRRASEANENYYLYNREYYWSGAYNFFKNSYYCGEETINFFDEYEEYYNNFKVLLPSCIYNSERKGDRLDANTFTSWYKPCKELYKELGMKYGKANSILYDSEENVICFDSKELMNEDIGFFINKGKLLNYLEKNNLSVLWTVLAEKRIIGDRHRDDNYIQPHCTGVYVLDEKLKLVGNIKIYEE